MTNPQPYPTQSHFAAGFALGVENGPEAEGWPKHPRGQHRAGSYIDNGKEGGELRPQLYKYTAPDGSDPAFPVPVAGDRIYVGRWFPGQTFAGGWGFASGFTGVGSLVGTYLDASGTLQTVTFAYDGSLSPNTDFTKFEIEAVNEVNPSGNVIDLFFELSTPPAAGDILKGRLDFVV